VIAMSKTRNLWVDYAKAIGIILVVYGHVARGVFNAGLNINKGRYELVDSVIYSFHMPLFFFLSGLFLLASMAKRDSISLLRSKIDTILYPYIIWSLLQGTIEAGLSHYTNGHVTMHEVLSLAWQPRAQFWFLYVLFFIFALALLAFHRSDNKWCSAVFIVSILLYFFGGQLPGGYLINMLSHYFVYFAVGVLASLLFNKINGATVSWTVLFIALFVFSQWLFQGKMGLRYNSGAPAVLLWLGLSGIACIVVLAQWLTRFDFRWLAHLGRHSMTIYLVHILAGSGCRIVLQKLLGISDVGVHLWVGTLGGLILPLLFYSTCMRFKLKVLYTPPKTLSLSIQN